MSTFFATIVMLLAATLCGGIVRFARLPLPVLQIVAGVILSSVFHLHIELEPELFLLVFVAPLLFVDGWRMPKRAFAEARRTILMLAFGLVVFSVVGVGYLLHAVVPMVPLAVAFAIAAALSPTDAVALSGIARRTPLPTAMQHVLEGEALMNDASGLVSMQVAVAAALTGAFSVGSAALTMVKVAWGGLLIGGVIAFIVSRLQRWLIGDQREQVAPQILLYLMIPFAAYHYSEALHCSGILAAVSAGMTMPRLELRSERHGASRLQTTVMFEMLGFALNGMIFVLLGMQLPSIFSAASSSASSVGITNHWELATIVVAVFVGLVLLRFVWAWTTIKSTLRRQKERLSFPVGRAAMIFSVAGVRGAVTLAAMLTLPDVPGRGLALVLGSCIILLSLATASIALPIWLRRLEVPVDDHAARIADEDRRTRRALLDASMSHLETVQSEAKDDASRDAATRLLEGSRWRSGALEADEDTSRVARELGEAIRQLKLASVRIERETLIALRARRAVDEEIYERILRELDTSELAVNTMSA